MKENISIRKGLLQESKSVDRNLFSESKGYLLNWKLQFNNSKIEKRYQQSAYLQNYKLVLILHAIQFAFAVSDFFNFRTFPFLTYIQLILSVLFFYQARRAEIKQIMQLFSFVLQFYFIFRLSNVQASTELYFILLVVWSVVNSIRWRSALILIIITIFIARSLEQYAEAQILCQSLSQDQVKSSEEELFCSQDKNTPSNSSIVEYINFFERERLNLLVNDKQLIYSLLISIVIIYSIEFVLRSEWRAIDQTIRSEKSYVQLFKLSSQPSFILSHQGIVLEINEKAVQILPNLNQQKKGAKSDNQFNFSSLLCSNEEKQQLTQALNQATLSKQPVYIRANIKLPKIIAKVNGNNNNMNDANNNNLNKQQSQPQSSQNSNQANDTQSNNNKSFNANGQTGSIASNNDTKASNAPQGISSPPVRHQYQAIQPPQIIKSAIQKFPYPFMSDQFDDLLKQEYLNLTNSEPVSKYFTLSITPFIWKESLAFLLNMTDLQEAQDFVKISNFFTKNLSERLVSVLSHTEEDFQKWANLAQLSQIKITDLRELSAVISESHGILSITSLLRYLNCMYIGQEKVKNQDFQITNLIISTIEAHSVRLQNYLKKIDLSFDNGFPTQVNGDPLSFYFVFYNLIYFMTYNCEYNEVDLSLGCIFLKFDNNSLILSFDFEFSATQEQTDFFLRVTKEFEELQRFIVQSDLQGHDIFDTIYLLTLNLIKQNEGSIHFEQVNSNNSNKKFGESSNPNSGGSSSSNQQLAFSGQSHSQQNIQPPPSSQQSSQQVGQQNPASLNSPFPSSQNIPAPSINFKNNQPKQGIVDSSAKQNHSKAPANRLKVVLEYVFNTAEMHTVIKRQGEPTLGTPSISHFSTDKKQPGKKYAALQKPPQIHLSFTRTKDKNKDQFQWKQCKEEEKKLQASFLAGKKADKPKPIQSLQMVSDENIPQPVQKQQDGISPLTAKNQINRKQSTKLSVIPSVDESKGGNSALSSFSVPNNSSNNNNNNTNNPNINNHPSATPRIKEQIPHQKSNNHIPNIANNNVQGVSQPLSSDKKSDQNNNNKSQSPTSKSQEGKPILKIENNPLLSQSNNPNNFKECKNDNKNDNHISNNKNKGKLKRGEENNNSLDKSNQTASYSKGVGDINVDWNEDSSGSSALNDLFSDSDSSSSIQFPDDLKKQIKQYIKLYNSNVVRDLSKIVRNILSQSKLNEDTNNSQNKSVIKILDRSLEEKKKKPHPFSQFCSPQLHPSRQFQSIKVHSAFKGLINSQKSTIKTSQITQNSISSLSRRKDSIATGEELTPKSIAPTRTSKTSLPNQLTSPSMMYNFRFRGERTLVQLKDPHLLGKAGYTSKSEQKPSIPWNELIPWNVHKSRSQRHKRRWILSDIWNKLYKKTDTVLVITSDNNDIGMIKSIFQQKRELGRELDFAEIGNAYESYMGYLREAQVHKYFLIDLRIKHSQIEKFQNDIRAQEAQSIQIPKAFFSGTTAITSFSWILKLQGNLKFLRLFLSSKFLKTGNHQIKDDVDNNHHKNSNENQSTLRKLDNDKKEEEKEDQNKLWKPGEGLQMDSFLKSSLKLIGKIDFSRYGWVLTTASIMVYLYLQKQDGSDSSDSHQRDMSSDDYQKEHDENNMNEFQDNQNGNAKEGIISTDDSSKQGENPIKKNDHLTQKELRQLSHNLRSKQTLDIDKKSKLRSINTQNANSGSNVRLNRHSHNSKRVEFEEEGEEEHFNIRGINYQLQYTQSDVESRQNKSFKKSKKYTSDTEESRVQPLRRNQILKIAKQSNAQDSIFFQVLASYAENEEE